MADKKDCCSCGGVFITTLVALGLVVGVGGYFAYKAIKAEIDKQNPPKVP